MYLHKSYPIPLYSTSKKTRIHIIVTDRKNWDKMIATLNFFSDIEEEHAWTYDDVSAFYTSTELKGISNFWIVFKDTKQSLSLNTLGHEVVHMVNGIFKSRGIKLYLDNDEPQAYLTGWVTQTVYQTIKRYIK